MATSGSRARQTGVAKAWRFSLAMQREQLGPTRCGSIEQAPQLIGVKLGIAEDAGKGAAAKLAMQGTTSAWRRPVFLSRTWLPCWRTGTLSGTKCHRA